VSAINSHVTRLLWAQWISDVGDSHNLWQNKAFRVNTTFSVTPFEELSSNTLMETMVICRRSTCRLLYAFVSTKLCMHLAYVAARWRKCSQWIAQARWSWYTQNFDKADLSEKNIEIQFVFDINTWPFRVFKEKIWTSVMALVLRTEFMILSWPWRLINSLILALACLLRRFGLGAYDASILEPLALGLIPINCKSWRRHCGESKTQNGHLSCKIALRLKKVCYKVSFCENCQRQSCKAFIGLTRLSVQKWLLGRPPSTWNFCQTDRVGAKLQIFYLFSLVAPQP